MSPTEYFSSSSNVDVCGQLVDCEDLFAQYNFFSPASTPHSFSDDPPSVSSGIFFSDEQKFEGNAQQPSKASDIINTELMYSNIGGPSVNVIQQPPVQPPSPSPSNAGNRGKRQALTIDFDAEYYALIRGNEQLSLEQIKMFARKKYYERYGTALLPTTREPYKYRPAKPYSKTRKNVSSCGGPV